MKFLKLADYTEYVILAKLSKYVKTNIQTSSYFFLPIMFLK